MEFLSGLCEANNLKEMADPLQVQIHTFTQGE
jgi:hypothetical protein